MTPACKTVPTQRWLSCCLALNFIRLAAPMTAISVKQSSRRHSQREQDLISLANTAGTGMSPCIDAALSPKHQDAAEKICLLMAETEDGLSKYATP